MNLRCHCGSVQHLFLLLSSTHRHQSVCPLRHLVLDQKHEPTCLWVHRMDTSHHVLHDTIQTKHETETTEKTNVFHAKRKLLASVRLIQMSLSNAVASAWWWLVPKLQLKLPICILTLYVHITLIYCIWWEFTVRHPSMSMTQTKQCTYIICMIETKGQTHHWSQNPPWCQLCGCLTWQTSDCWLWPKCWKLTQLENQLCHEANLWCTCQCCESTVNMSYQDQDIQSLKCK